MGMARKAGRRRRGISTPASISLPSLEQGDATRAVPGRESVEKTEINSDAAAVETQGQKITPPKDSEFVIKAQGDVNTLPPGFEMRVLPDGTTFFVDFIGKQTVARDPRTNDIYPYQDPLPEEFRVETTTKGLVLFVDMITGEHFEEDPRKNKPEEPDTDTSSEKSLRYSDFHWIKSSAMQKRGSLRRMVSSSSIVGDSAEEAGVAARRLSLASVGESEDLGLEAGIELLDHKIQSPPQDLSSYSGWIQMKSTGISVFGRRWLDRWCKLDRNVARCFVDEAQRDERCSFSLEQVLQISANSEEKDNSEFFVVTVARTFYFRSKDGPAGASEWMAEFQKRLREKFLQEAGQEPNGNGPKTRRRAKSNR